MLVSVYLAVSCRVWVAGTVVYVGTVMCVSFTCYVAFPRFRSVQSAKVRHGSRFHRQKWARLGLSRTEPHSSRSALSVVVLRRLKGCRQVWAGRAVRWLVDKIVPSARQGDNKQTQYPRGSPGQRRKLLFMEENVCAKVCCPSWTAYMVALCSLRAFFRFLWFISRLHCVGLLWDHDAYVAAVAIAVWLIPLP